MGYRAPAAPVPDLQAVRRTTTRTDQDRDHISIQSAIEPRFDQNLVNTLEGVADGSYGLSWVPKLSHYSRSYEKLLWVLEFVLAHDATVLTTNYMIRPKDVWVRRKAFIKPTELAPADAYRDMTGLSGAHRQIVDQLLNEI